MAYQNDRRTDPVVFAPYNFVPFPRNPFYISDENDIVGHNAMPGAAEEGEELYSGEIQYTIEAMTPVFVDDGTKEHRFCRNAEGNYIIPGSTMRGLVRSHAMVLGFGNVRDEIDDYSLMYRNVANGLNKKRYGEILGASIVRMTDANGKEQSLSILKNVQAGYIEKRADGKYIIYRTILDQDEKRPPIDKNLGKMNYYTLSERTVIQQYLKNKSAYEADPDSFDFSYLLPEMKDQMMNQTQEFRKVRDKRGGISWQGKNNTAYMPYYKEVMYKLQGKRKISSLKPVPHEDLSGADSTGKTEEMKGFLRGELISTGYMQKKKVIYVIPEINHREETALELSDRDIRDFKVDYNRRKNSIALEKKNPNRMNKKKVEEFKAFFDLPEKTGEAGRKPVFYILYGGRCYFGFTPRLRLFYDNTVADGLPEEHVKEKTDYVKAIFGYTKSASEDGKQGSGARKTRVSFSDAEQDGMNGSTECPEPLPVRYLTLSEPRPTDCLNYLDQSMGETSYNSRIMELRGAKQYWLHREADPGLGPEDYKEKMDSAISPLDAGTAFTGKIRFRNLRKYELGLVLWAIRLEKNSWMNLGKGKSYGYGAMKLTKLHASAIDHARAYAIDPENTADLFGNLYRDLDIEEFIKAYREFAREKNGGRDIFQIPLIRDFFAMKDSTRIPEASQTEYMNLEQFQEQTRTRTPLPTIMEIAGKETGSGGGAVSEPQNEVVFLAGYPLSDSQKAKLEKLSGMKVKHIQEWPNDDNVASLSRQFAGIALPSNAYPRFLEVSKRFCGHVYQSVKTGKVDDGWVVRK